MSIFWEPTNDPAVHIEVERNGTVLRMRRVTDDGWRIVTVYALVDGELRLCELHIEPNGPDPTAWRNQSLMMISPVPVPAAALTARLLRSVRLDEELDRALKLAVDHGFVSSGGQEFSDDLSALVAKVAVPAFAKLRESEPAHPGRRGRPDEYLVIIAAVYADMLLKKTPAPAKATADLLGLSPGYVRNALHRARRRGILSNGPKGRAGGALTEAGLAAVRSIGAEKD